jgi:hypothetical protein
MDFLMTALGDVFGWIFLASSSLTVVLGAAAVIGFIACAISGGSFVLPLVVVSFCALSALAALMALIGEYMQRIYRQTSGTPMYMIRRVHEPSGTAADAT